MEIVFYNDDRGIHGVLDRRLGYSIEARKSKGGTRYFSVRKAGYLIGLNSDTRHAQFILCMARMAINDKNLLVKDIRLTVREFIDAHASLVCGVPLDHFGREARKELLWQYCKTLGLWFRKVKPSSVLDANDVICLRRFLERR